jgi:hypothetical protein
MIAAATVAIAVMGALLALVLVMQRWERHDWADERRALIDRAIARHTGEVIGLDRQASRSTNGPDVPAHRAPIEGLE